LGDQIKEDEMGRHVIQLGDMRKAYIILVGKPEGKRQLGRRSHRWEYNIKMDLRKTV
jgi:hypothetical protein